MRILFAGASGTLGTALVPQLRAAGHEVLAITRSRESAARLGSASIVADAMDREGLLAALAGVRADVVLHELTALASAPTHYRSMKATNDLRTTGTANLVEAARLVGARRMVTQSIVFGYGYRRAHPAPVDESAPFATPEGAPVDTVHAALASTEQQVRDAEGLEGIALRYGLFYGRDAAPVRRMLGRRMLPVTRSEGVIPFIHHEDAAAATLAAIERGTPGAAYNIADDSPASWRRYVTAAATALGAPAPITVPVWLARAAVPYAAELMTRLDLRVSSDKARAELGWSPRYPTVEQGWAAAASEGDA